MSVYKTVNMPIQVPIGEHCWDGINLSCEHFDNEGGHGTCDLGFHLPYSYDQGDLKPLECLNLKVVEL